jgi:hypothetical protein
MEKSLGVDKCDEVAGLEKNFTLEIKKLPRPLNLGSF